jgi:hypothetical protein
VINLEALDPAFPKPGSGLPSRWPGPGEGGYPARADRWGPAYRKQTASSSDHCTDLQLRVHVLCSLRRRVGTTTPELRGRTCSPPRPSRIGEKTRRDHAGLAAAATLNPQVLGSNPRGRTQGYTRRLLTRPYSSSTRERIVSETDSESRKPIQEVLGGLEVHPLQSGWTPIEAFLLIKCLDADGKSSWSYRTTNQLNREELLGALMVHVELLRRELVGEWEDGN